MDVNRVYPVGTRVVSKQPIRGEGYRDLHPAGAVGVVCKSRTDAQPNYRVRFPDGFEAMLPPDQISILSDYQNEAIGAGIPAQHDLRQRVIYQCVMGSRAYGLSTDQSDTDRRGIFLPTAQMHWSLYGVPEQIEDPNADEVYWEVQKFVVLALKANPNLLECLYSPIVEAMTPLGEHLLSQRDMFLSKLAYQTYNGYVVSQFKKIQADLRNQGNVKWKHVMHMIRLLHSGIHLLKHGTIRVNVGDERDRLLAIKSGDVEWPQIQQWQRELQSEFDQAYQETLLPARPDYQRANEFLIHARRLATEERLP